MPDETIAMSAEQMRFPGIRSAVRYSEQVDCRLHEIRREAEESWAPGQALGEILSYVDRIEDFIDSEVAASFAQTRMRWLTAVLQSAAWRAQAIGLDPERLKGIFGALARHDALLSSERTLAGSAARAARDLIRLEITYLRPEKQDF